MKVTRTRSLTDTFWLACLAMGALCVMASGCQQGLYDWGSYEKSLWLTCARPENVSTEVDEQIDILSKEIQETLDSDKPDKPSRVPPGKFAHLGYLFALQGNTEQARNCFESEKKLYPESSRFIDGMLARMQ
ncbi:MAG: DUF4810 domain-containing protein [Phycisphaeraceae bacterium]|nr:DUF4810 domain-containing protein [Phycisphaeraceae bacterium]